MTNRRLFGWGTLAVSIGSIVLFTKHAPATWAMLVIVCAAYMAGYTHNLRYH